LRRQRSGALVSLCSFSIPLPRAQRIRNQLPGRSLRLPIARSKRQRLVPHTIGLTVIASGISHAPELDPQQWIVRLDAHGALDRGGRATEVASVHMFVSLCNQR
jgi:hypothetical protein